MKLTGFVTFLPFFLQMKFYLTNLAEDLEKERQNVLKTFCEHMSYLSGSKIHRRLVSEILDYLRFD